MRRKSSLASCLTPAITLMLIDGCLRSLLRIPIMSMTRLTRILVSVRPAADGRKEMVCHRHVIYFRHAIAARLAAFPEGIAATGFGSRRPFGAI